MNPPGWLVDRLPEWARSIRFRYTLLYSAVLFGLAAVVVAAIYLVLLMALRNQPVSAGRGLWCRYGECIRFVSLSEFERLVNSQILTKLRNYSFGALGVLFVASLGVGWVVAGRVLRPIGRITSVAREIQATDLSRRIELPGPDDELKQLADTFDAMLARLDAAFAAQRQFTADASHELRNPLAAIRGYAELTRHSREEMPGDAAYAMSRVESEADRMSHLVEDLLLLARLDSGPYLDQQPIDLAEVVVNAVSDARAAGPDHVWRLSVPDEPVVALADRNRMHQVVTNLLANARTHTPPGTSVETGVAVEGGEAVLTVTDDGPGIPADIQPRVFERFTRADVSRVRTPGAAAGGSTGLGLAIVAAVVEAHHGRVAVSSVPGQTRFTVTLPLAAESAAAQGARAP